MTSPNSQTINFNRLAADQIIGTTADGTEIRINAADLATELLSGGADVARLSTDAASPPERAALAAFVLNSLLATSRQESRDQ